MLSYEHLLTSQLLSAKAKQKNNKSIKHESNRRVDNSTELPPFILDGSIFTSFSHHNALARKKAEFFVSDRLYGMLYGQSERANILTTLRYFTWGRPVGYLPSDELNLKPYLKPYKFKKNNVQEILPYFEKSKLPTEVKEIILDEYSFLKEHSTILMCTKSVARLLHQWGIVLLDASNQLYTEKHDVLEIIRGPRWILAFLVGAMALTEFSKNPKIAKTLGGVASILVLLDS